MKITRKGEVIRKGTWLCAIKFCLWEGYNYGEGGLYLVGKQGSMFQHFLTQEKKKFILVQKYFRTQIYQNRKSCYLFAINVF